jgi:hypothetical protein
MIALIKSLGKETAATGIRVNCLTLAAIKTLLFDQMTAQKIEFMLFKIPSGGTRRDRRGDLARLLARPARSARSARAPYSTLPVDGQPTSRALRHVRVAKNLRECVVASADDHSSSGRSVRRLFLVALTKEPGLGRLDHQLMLRSSESHRPHRWLPFNLFQFISIPRISYRNGSLWLSLVPDG